MDPRVKPADDGNRRALLQTYARGDARGPTDNYGVSMGQAVLAAALPSAACAAARRAIGTRKGEQET